MSEGDFGRLLNSKRTHFKSNQRDSEILNLVSECAQYGKNTSIHDNVFIDYEIIQCLFTSYQVLVVGWTSQSPRREVHGFGRPASGEGGSRGVSPRERTGITATKATEGAKSASVRVKARDAGGRTGQVCWDT